MMDEYFFYESTLAALKVISSVWWDAEPEGRAILNEISYYLRSEGIASLPEPPKNTDAPTFNRPFNKFLMRGSGVNPDSVSRF